MAFLFFLFVVVGVLWLVFFDGLKKLSSLLGYHQGFPVIAVNPYDKTVDGVMLSLVEKLKTSTVAHFERTEFKTTIVFTDGIVYRIWTANKMYGYGTHGNLLKVESGMMDRIDEKVANGKSIDSVISFAEYMEKGEPYPSWYTPVLSREGKFEWDNKRGSRKTNDRVETAILKYMESVGLDTRSVEERKKENERKTIKLILGDKE